MRAAVLGSGLMGSVISWDLSRSPEVDEVVVADIDQLRLAALKKRAGPKLSTEVVDVADGAKLVRFLKGFDVVSSALPHGIVHPANVAAGKAGARMVDIAFEDEQMELGSLFKKNGGLLVPGCGLAPGLGGILLAQGLRELGTADEGHVLVGGLPQKPQPPFGYRLVFSIIGLLREYMDIARIVRGGKVVQVRPFDDVLEVEFPKPIGRCEAFYTDGLATLLYSVKGLKEMDEMTVRWPGHAEKMKFLIDAGFLSKEKITLRGAQVSPFELSAALLSERLRNQDPEDVTVMRVVVKGKAGEVRYEMLDYYDEKNGVTSMGRTTGYTCSIVSQMVGAGKVRGTGVVPPEEALDAGGVKSLLAELGRRGVRVTQKRTG